MNLYLVSQEYNNDYDTYDRFIVVAQSEEDAVLYDPYGEKYPWDSCFFVRNSWCDNPKQATAELIGKASEDLKEGQIVISSFKAG